MPERSIRIILAIDHPAQQFRRGLQLLSSQAGIDAQVIYWSTATHFHDSGFDRHISWDIDLLGGYRWISSPSKLAMSRLGWTFRQLRSERPDVVVCYGWASPIARASIVYCLLTRTKVLLYGDSTWQHPSRGWRRIVRSVGLHLLTRMCTGAISTGVFNREFYILYGMNPRRIWPGVCPSDTEPFMRAHADRSYSSNEDDRQLRIGFAGKLMAIKGVDELLLAASQLPRDQLWSITIVGDGPLRSELEGLAAHLGINSRVSFRGFANASEMPTILAGFDVVVVPSRLDRRTHVTIEAMAAGAAVIVSDATAVWGPGDLIENGETGLIYTSGDSAALAERLRCLLEDRQLLAGLQRNGMERAAKFGPESFAPTLARAALMCGTMARN